MDRRFPGATTSLSPSAETKCEASDGFLEMTLRQLNEDIAAYNYDLDYCKSELSQQDLSPRETRNLRLRTLDLGHHIRHCRHRIEVLRLHRRSDNKRPLQAESEAPPRKRRRTLVPKTIPSPYLATPQPEQIPSPADDDDDDDDDNDTASPEQASINTKQRLGFWECRLCTSPEYLSAGPDRLPSAPCKWPLKDIGKLISHHLSLHVEQTPDRRCRELGEALLCNLGPFEYWLCKTKGQDIGDGRVIVQCVDELGEGKLPPVLRRLHKAVAGFPE